MGANQRTGRARGTYMAALASLTILGAAACGTDDSPTVAPTVASSSSAPTSSAPISSAPISAEIPASADPATGVEVPAVTDAVVPPAEVTTDAGLPVEASTEAPAETTAAAPAEASTYTDGTYTEEGNYISPGGDEHVSVTVTLVADVVTEVTVTPESTNPNGQNYQGQFAAGIAAEVVGKDIDTLSVSKVGGSSLTSGGFNAAIESIKADALG